MEGTFSGNLFVSDTLRDIDRLSKAGQAEPTDYETLIALENAPKRFGQITVTFKDEDHVLGRVNLEYGDSLDESGYPELPAKEGCAARWSTTKLTDLHLDTVVEAVYTDYITALASIYEREDGRPVFFAKGSFGDRDSLTVSVRDLPGNTAELAVVPGSSVPAWVIVTAAAAVVLAGGTVLIRRRKKAPIKHNEPPRFPQQEAGAVLAVRPFAGRYGCGLDFLTQNRYAGNIQTNRKLHGKGENEVLCFVQ